MKETINKILMQISTVIEKYKIMFFLNILVFLTFISTAIYMYQIGNIWLGDDILLAMGIYLLFNKMDK